MIRPRGLPIDLFLNDVRSTRPFRVKGTAVFMTSNPDGAPPVLLHHFKHNKVLHQRVVMLSVQTRHVPEVRTGERLEVRELGEGFWQVTASYGFMQTPDVPEALQLLRSRGVQLDDMETSYFLSRDIVIPTLGDGMWLWREKLFASMHRNAAAAADFLNLPTNRIVELGTKVEI